MVNGQGKPDPGQATPTLYTLYFQVCMDSFSFHYFFKTKRILCEHSGQGASSLLVWKRHNIGCTLIEFESVAPVSQVKQELMTARAKLQRCCTDTCSAVASTLRP